MFQVVKGNRTITSDLQNSTTSNEWYSYIQQTISGKVMNVYSCHCLYVRDVARED